MASCAPKSLSSASSIIAVRYAAAGDDMGATVHLRLRLVRVASIKGRENLVTVAVGQHAAPSMYFLSPDATLRLGGVSRALHADCMGLRPSQQHGLPHRHAL